MVDKNAFLKAYNIDEEDFKAADISWEELAAIYDDYLSIEEKLRGIGKDFVNDYLYDIERAGIHSYRYRTKNPGHLLEKIIRKRKEDPEKFKDLNRNNYYKYMTDLIGIRVFSCIGKTGSISTNILPQYLKIIRIFMSKTEGEILTKILFIATLRSVRRYIGEMVIPAFTMKILLISNPMAFTVLCTISSNIKGIM